LRVGCPWSVGLVVYQLCLDFCLALIEMYRYMTVGMMRYTGSIL